MYSASTSGNTSSKEAPGGRGRRRLSLMLCVLGGLPALVMAVVSPVRSACLLWALGTLPWVFAAMAATGFESQNSGRAWNVLLAGVLLLDGWFGAGTLLSRDVYYSMMVHATPFLNIALLVGGYGLLMLSPAVSRRFSKRRLPSASAAKQLRQTTATNLAAR
ncbi:MAG: hypothetical protein NXI04_15325 [Planctomycetaceae bacterium]|nr:hypothetical protein [Planctomycetaceae bacterium]